VPAQAAELSRWSYKANGVTALWQAEAVPASGKALSKIRFTRDGYFFAGWANQPDTQWPVLEILGDFNAARSNRTICGLGSRQLKGPSFGSHTIGALLWSDEFTGPSGGQVNSAFGLSRLCGHDATRTAAGTCHNNEPQWYTPDAIALDGSSQGNAVITTTRLR
jgi:hypothetical protein